MKKPQQKEFNRISYAQFNTEPELTFFDTSIPKAGRFFTVTLFATAVFGFLRFFMVL